MRDSVSDLDLPLFLSNRTISNEDLTADCISSIRKIFVETPLHREAWQLLELVGDSEEISDSKEYNAELVLWTGTKDKRLSFDPMTIVIDYLVMKMNNYNS